MKNRKEKYYLSECYCGNKVEVPVSTSITVATRKNISRRNAISAIEDVGILASDNFLFLSIFNNN